MSTDAHRRGIALLMVIMTLSALLLIGVPFFISMIGFGRTGDASRRSEITETGSYGSVQWAMESLARSDELANNEPAVHYGDTGGSDPILDPDDLPERLKNRDPLHSGVRIQDETGRIDVNSLTLQLASNLVHSGTHSQASYKMVLWPIRPEGNQIWDSEDSTPEAPREIYRPFRGVSGIREIANVLNIDKAPVPQNPPDNIGYLDRDTYMNIQDCLRMDYERIKTDRWFKAGVLVGDSVVNDTIIYTGISPVVSTGTLIFIRDQGTGDCEYNFCRSVSYTASDIQKNRMKLLLLFGLQHSYSEGTTYISIPERVPVNINTASYKVLKAVLWGIRGTVKGSAVTVTEDDAEAVAADIVSRREDAPFGPDMFMEYDIASVIGSADKAALIKIHAFNPYDRRLTVSTVGFRFASDRTFRISGMSSVINPHAGLQTFRTVRETVVNIYPGVQGSEAVWGPSSQYEFLRDSMFRGGGLLTGPNPLQASDFGTVPLGDLGTKNGVQDFEDNDTEAASYVTLAPLKLYWNTGYNEKTSFVLHADSGTKATILDGDKGLGLYSTGDQTNKGTAKVFGSGSTDYPKNDFTPEGIALGTDDGEDDEDYLEYEIHDGDDGSDCKLRRDPEFDDIVYEGFSFECWFRPAEEWDSNHYFFDIQRTDAEEPDNDKKNYQNKISLLYDGAESELVLRIADTSAKQTDTKFAELRQKASFATGLWYHLKAVIRGGAETVTVTDQLSTDYKAALFIDGKPCWKLDPAPAADIEHPKLGPGADLKQDLPAGADEIHVDSGDAFPASGGVVQIGRERIEYEECSDNKLKQCVRGCRGTGTNPDPVVTGDGETHPAGSRVLLFGYSCSLKDEPLMTGGGLLKDSIVNDSKMPEITVEYDKDGDSTADLSFNEGEGSVTIPSDYTIDDFPGRGFLEIVSGTDNAIVYYTKAGNTLSLDWDDITTADEENNDLVFPAGVDQSIIFTVISIRVDSYNNYPKANEFDGQKGYIQIEDEWFRYGRDECEAGKFEHSGEYYFIGTRSPSMRASAGMGGDSAAHDGTSADIKVIPVFRVKDNNMAPIMSNTINDINEKVTIVDVNNGDVSIEDSKEEMTLNYSGREGGRNWLAFTDNVAHQYNIEVGTRILKFPSGEMPAVLSQTMVVGNSRNTGTPLKGQIDEVVINRSGYRTAHIIGIDGSGEITSTDTIDASNTRHIEIIHTWTSANIQKNDDFRKVGFLRINNEILAYIFDPFDPPQNDRYRLKLIKRGCFHSEQTVHRKLDTVFILDGIPCTTVHLGEELNEDKPRIFVQSTEGFPPCGFLKIDEEIIGYTFKGNMTGWKYFGMEKQPDSTNPVGFWRGRFGSEPASHEEDALVTLFPARYPDRTPLRFESGSVTHRWDPAHGIYFRKVITRDKTVFGLEGTGDDLTVKASVLDENGDRQTLPSGTRVRILVGAGRNIDWTQEPSGTSVDFDTGLQEFKIESGEGGGSAVSFDLGARKTNRLEIRVFFEYVSGAWQASKESAIYDPSGTGIFSWKMCPVVEEITVKVKGRNAVYETLHY